MDRRVGGQAARPEGQRKATPYPRPRSPAARSCPLRERARSGLERPGRAVRVGWSCLSPSSERLARARRTVLAALLCSLGRERQRAPAGGPRHGHAPPGTPRHLPRRPLGPSPHSPTETRCGTRKRGPPSVSWVWRPGLGLNKVPRLLVWGGGGRPALRSASGPFPVWGPARAE